jgi:hypothetical protein
MKSTQRSSLRGFPGYQSHFCPIDYFRFVSRFAFYNANPSKEDRSTSDVDDLLSQCGQPGFLYNLAKRTAFEY